MSVKLTDSGGYRLTLLVAALVVLQAVEVFGVLGAVGALLFVAGLFYVESEKIPGKVRGLLFNWYTRQSMSITQFPTDKRAISASLTTSGSGRGSIKRRAASVSIKF